MTAEKPIIFFISPHPDDIALDVGGTLPFLQARRDAQRFSMSLYTVFTKSIYSPYVMTTPLTEKMVSMLRRDEEERFCELSACELVVGDIPDTSILGYSDEEECSCRYHDDPRVLQVCDFFSSCIDPDICFIPAGIGGHVDHRIVREQALARFGETSEVVFYEDLPYAAELEGTELRRIIQEVIPHTYVEFQVDISSTIDLKIARLAECYHSQLSDRELMLVRNHAAMLGRGRFHERFWIRRSSKTFDTLLRGGARA